MQVELTYFKPTTGKYYFECWYHSWHSNADDIYREVRYYLHHRKLPGLNEGHGNYNVLVNANGVPPCLIMENGE